MGFFLPLLTGLIGAGASFYSNKKSVDSQVAANDFNTKMQYDFAKHGIRWRVADAKEAGIHPLASLGANLTTPYPTNVGGDYSNLNDMGQYVQKGLETVLDKNAKKKLELEQENQELQNQILQTELDKRRLELIRDTAGGSARSNPIDDHYGVVNDISGVPNNGSSANFGSLGHEYVKKQIPYSSRIGTESGTEPFFRDMVDSKGRTFQVPSESLQDMVTEVSPVAVDYWKDYILDTAKAHFYKRFPGAAGAPMHREYLLRMRPTAPEGYEQRAVITSTGIKWMLRKIIDGKSYLYDDKSFQLNKQNYHSPYRSIWESAKNFFR